MLVSTYLETYLPIRLLARSPAIWELTPVPLVLVMFCPSTTTNTNNYYSSRFMERANLFRSLEVILLLGAVTAPLSTVALRGSSSGGAD